MRVRPYLLSLSILASLFVAADAFAVDEPTRDIKIVSSAGARALADACSAWAQQNKLVVAMAILDWGAGSGRMSRHLLAAAPTARLTAVAEGAAASSSRKPLSWTVTV